MLVVVVAQNELREDKSMSNINETIEALKKEHSGTDLSIISEKLKDISKIKTIEDRKTAFDAECQEQHRQIIEASVIIITEENIEEHRKTYPDAKVGDTFCRNSNLSEMIEKDRLTLFQYDYLVDECGPEEMTLAAREKIERMWTEIRFLLTYYNVLSP